MIDDRAGVSIVAVVLVVAVTVAAASTVAAVAVDPGDPAPVAVVGATASQSGEITLTHRAGEPLDPEELELKLSIDGEPLAHQPPVPFFAARGFAPGPTGAFNSAASDPLRPGGSTTFRIAPTNEPTPSAGSTVRIRLWVDGQPVTDVTATA